MGTSEIYDHYMRQVVENMRLDRFLCQMNMGSRSEVKELIRKRKVSVNGVIALSAEQKIDETKDIVDCNGQKLYYRPFVYYMMNKPQGVVSATTDKREQTVLDLLLSFLPECDKKRNLVPVGRLDKDTEGLLLFTDDGALAHSLLSPKRHVNKSYLTEIAHPLSSEEVCALECGVDISATAPPGEKEELKNRLTYPARVSRLDDQKLVLSVREGRFHQIKRMLQAVDNEVTGLRRIRFGPLELDSALAPGACRELTSAEVELLKYIEQRQTGQTAMMKEIQAVIFDLDGTMVDSMWMWHQIDIEYLGKFGIPVPDRLQESIEGMSFHETAVYFKKRFRIPDTLDEIKADWNRMAWEKYEKEVPLKPGVAAFLADCQKRGIKMGIATSNSRELVNVILKSHGLESCFSVIKTGCEVLKGKPAPDIYLAAAKELDIAPEHCLVFEDILPGIQAGINAGMRVCAVEDFYSADIRRQKMELADYFIKDYAEIIFV